MTTLITFSASGGRGGRCDAKCYDAKEPRCDCICGGANHGVGLNQAIEHLEGQADVWIDQYKADHPGQEIMVDIPQEIQYCLPLLNLEVSRSCPTS